jgi:hypothetical protein
MPDNPLVIPDGFALVTLIWRWSGRLNPFTCQCGVKVENPVTPAPEQIAQDVYELSITTDNPCAPAHMFNEYSFIGVKCIENVGGDLLVGEYDHVTVGTIAGQLPLINSGTVIVSKRTGVLGRKYRGRMYPPQTYLPEGSFDAGGRTTDANIALLQAQWSAWYTAMADADYTPYLLHTEASAVPPTQITSLLVRPNMGTQRRRIRG